MIIDGVCVGKSDGAKVGCWDGNNVVIDSDGASEEISEGGPVGLRKDESEGRREGDVDGISDGKSDGIMEG